MHASSSPYRTLFDLSGKTALVVGAGAGVGQAAAEGLAAFGARFVCADVRLEPAQATAETLRAHGGQGEAVRLDVTKQSEVEAVVGEVAGALDVLVCTPAVNVRKPLLELSEAEFDRVVALNLKGSFFALQAAGRRMAAQGRGSVILFSSIRSQVVEPGRVRRDQGGRAADGSGARRRTRA